MPGRPKTIAAEALQLAIRRSLSTIKTHSRVVSISLWSISDEPAEAAAAIVTSFI